jgi:hypothetical protein
MKSSHYCEVEGCRKKVTSNRLYCYIHETKAVNLIAKEVKRLRSIQQTPTFPFYRSEEDLEESEKLNYQ